MAPRDEFDRPLGFENHVQLEYKAQLDDLG
jgi:hypothetical protein